MTKFGVRGDPVAVLFIAKFQFDWYVVAPQAQKYAKLALNLFINVCELSGDE